jgi:hypothetical protein
MTATDELPEVPQEQPRCDHICLKDADHVKRGERHFYGYELPSPRDLAAALRATETQRDDLRTDLTKADECIDRMQAKTEALTEERDDALAALREAVDWMDSPGGDPTSEELLARWRRILDSQGSAERRAAQRDAAYAVIRHLLAGDEPPNTRHHWRDTDTPVTPAEAEAIAHATRSEP